MITPLQNNDFFHNCKISQKLHKKNSFGNFQIWIKLAQRYPKITFSLFSKLPKNYTKITFSIPTAPRSGAICILFVISVYFVGNFENNENVIFGYLFINFDPNLKIAKTIFFV